MGVNGMLAEGALDYLSGGAALGSPNVAALGYLPRSLIFITSGPNAGKLRFKQKFAYSTTFKPLTHSTNATNNIQIQADSEFVWISASIDIRSSDDFTTFTQPNAAPMTVLITDGASGNLIMNEDQAVGNFFGNVGAPNVSLGVPFIFRRSGVISVKLTNQHTATDFNVRVAFQGFKVYDIPAEGE